MKKILLILTFSIAASSMLSAQAITFAIEKNNLFFEDGSVAGRNADDSIDNRNQLTVWAGFAAGAALTSFETGITDYLNDSSVATLNSTLNSLTWVAVPVGTGLFTSSRDYNLSGASGTLGDSAILLVSTASSYNNLIAGDEIGLVTSTTTVPEFGTVTIGFNTGDSWDSSYLGTLGSLTMATVVPEPSTYAALAGLCALGAVALRRRRA